MAKCRNVQESGCVGPVVAWGNRLNEDPRKTMDIFVERGFATADLWRSEMLSRMEG